MNDCIKTVSSAYIQNLLKYLEAKGYKATPFLQAARIPPSCLQKSDVRIDGKQMHRLIMAISDITLMPCKPEAIELLDKLFTRCRNLEESLRESCSFWSAIQHICTLTMHLNGEFCKIEVAKDARSSRLHILNPLFILTYIHRFHSWMIGKPIKLHHASLAAKAEYPADDQCFLPCPIRYQQTMDAIWFSAAYLKCALVQSDEEILSTKPERYLNNGDLFAEPGNGLCFSNQVEKLLSVAYEMNTSSSLESIASELCISPATLRYRLKQEDNNFQTLKDRVRCDLAKRSLRTTDLSIGSIAQQTGFAETAAFTRSFKKWTNVTPVQYRESMHQTVR